MKLYPNNFPSLQLEKSLKVYFYTSSHSTKREGNGTKIYFLIHFWKYAFPDIGVREATKKKSKKISQQVWTMGGRGQQILVCEPQKSAFFRANFPKKHAVINS